jgi:restriction system protein
MPRYWVIAPYHADRPEFWEKVWQFDLDNNLISIGWRELGDVSSLSEQGLKTAIERTYSNAPPPAKRIYFRMLWDFYHSVEPGDIVVARRGTKRIAAVGTVVRKAYYERAKNAAVMGPENTYPNHIDVQWNEIPRNKEFANAVFGMQTLYEISEEKYHSLIESDLQLPAEAQRVEEDIEDQAAFVLEKYLEDFIVSNFSTIFRGQLTLYADPQQNITGQQYSTDVGDIDILAEEPATNAFVVIELKKGRESDKVVGQILRYMGWVAENLCQQGQTVKGMIICKEPDPRLSYALKMTSNIIVKYYQIDFKLSDEPWT